MFTWGNGDFDQLGDGRRGDNCHWHPQPLRLLERWYPRSETEQRQPRQGPLAMRVACGAYHTLLLMGGDGGQHKNDHEMTTLLAWGLGSDGQLANGLRQNEPLPFSVPLPSPLRGRRRLHIAAGWAHSVFASSTNE